MPVQAAARPQVRNLARALCAWTQFPSNHQNYRRATQRLRACSWWLGTPSGLPHSSDRGAAGFEPTETACLPFAYSLVLGRLLGFPPHLFSGDIPLQLPREAGNSSSRLASVPQRTCKGDTVQREQQPHPKTEEEKRLNKSVLRGDPSHNIARKTLLNKSTPIDYFSQTSNDAGKGMNIL